MQPQTILAASLRPVSFALEPAVGKHAEAWNGLVASGLSQRKPAGLPYPSFGLTCVTSPYLPFLPS